MTLHETNPELSFLSFRVDIMDNGVEAGEVSDVILTCLADRGYDVGVAYLGRS